MFFEKFNTRKKNSPFDTSKFGKKTLFLLTISRKSTFLKFSHCNSNISFSFYQFEFDDTIWRVMYTSVVIIMPLITNPYFMRYIVMPILILHKRNWVSNKREIDFTHIYNVKRMKIRRAGVGLFIHIWKIEQDDCYF